MKPGNIPVFTLLFWTTIAEHATGNRSASSTSILGVFINGTLESIRPVLAHLYINHKDFKTGSQEFGNFMGDFREVKVEGLEKFHVKTLCTKGFDITNLTIVEKSLTAKGLYNLNGNMAFPLGKNDIHLFGSGEFGAEFSNFSVSVKMKIRYENGKKTVKDFDMFVGLESMQIYFKNLMGGSDLEKAFNQIINVAAIPVFNYYKEPVLDVLKPQVVEFINKIINNQD